MFPRPGAAMEATAIDDHVTTKLYSWYTVVSEWEPPGEGFEGICTECAESALADIVDVSAWPHHVMHLLVESLRTAISDVEYSYAEECFWDSEAAPEVAHRAVAAALSPYAADIHDVLEQCLSERVQDYLATQVAQVDLQFRRPAAP
ncbi:MAG: hypothetical protein KF761_06995 [Salinibacterium sp.]|nr:hypothetical protein [Salinibacterium sp.]